MVHKYMTSEETSLFRAVLKKRIPEIAQEPFKQYISKLVAQTEVDEE